MKKILILGGSGMLGHKLYQVLKERYDTRVTVRGSYGSVEDLGVFDKKDVREYVDALDFDSVIRALASAKPDVIINCIGLIKQQPMSYDPLSAITINALLPHRLSLISASSKIRMIHISTDCVFSGKTGNYEDDAISDAEDIYGRSKFMGEVNYKPHTVTLRTSIIGRELRTKLGLVEWFLSKEKEVKGYKNAIFSGFTTTEFSNIIAQYVIPNEQLTGTYNVSSNPISKYDLLMLIKEAYNKNILIKPNEDVHIDRSLNSRIFRSIVGYQPPSWEKLIEEMKKGE